LVTCAEQPAKAVLDLPAIPFPADLPVSARRQQIAAAIAKHQVVIVSGETGSGKTTQLPKILLQMGRGQSSLIGHTQPRRIAARSVAERLSVELGTKVGGLVGYQMRFTDHTGPDTRVKVMTDGILLAQIQRDPKLLAYDTIIIDEAHERSLNIDFLLGYLSNLLPRRPDLKLIITSATIDSELFARHFGRPGRPAPVIKVTGRTYPVEVRYRPLGVDGFPEDQAAGIVAAARELMVEGPGDMLVFCSGEREIRDATDALIGGLGAVNASDAVTRSNLEVLPLYSRLSAAEQHRVFERHSRRRIVVATNVAETSLTVPGVHYVIDPGTARISRYSKATKVQRLPIEEISQASANQRTGRSGRIAKGVCLRLYSQESFAARPEFTEPEILRTSLASVILQMIAVGVAKSPDDVARFPFVQKPDSRNVQDGVKTLEELGAIQNTGGRTKLTAVGRQLARLPIDPRLGRMLVAAGPLGVTKEVTVLAAALSIQDVRERPVEFLAQADQLHARFKDPASDFLGLLKLWQYVRQARKDNSASAFRRLVRAEYLNYLRIREWQDLVAELRRALKDASKQGGKPSRTRYAKAGQSDDISGRNLPGSAESPEQLAELLDGHFDADRIHQAVLAGLVSHIGLQRATTIGTGRRQDDGGRKVRMSRGARNDYIGPRGANFAIFPGSALFSKPPEWLMAAELVETSRLWARTCARIDPAWVEQVAPHLARRSHHSPRWSARRGSAVITEKVLVYGLPVVAGRTVQLAPVDQAMARELFIRHALVLGEWQTHHQFWVENQRLLDKLEQSWARSKRAAPDLSEEDLFEFYNARVPSQIVSVAHFDRWWSRAVKKTPDLLTLRGQVLGGAEQDLGAGFPDLWPKNGFDLPVTYLHSPGTSADGVTVHLRVDLANQIRPDGFDWQVPGLRQDLVAALIKALPKREKAMLLPAADTARQAVLALADPSDWLLPNGRVMSITQALTQVFQSLRGIYLPPDIWAEGSVPDYLKVRFQVEDSQGRVIAAGRDLEQVVAEATPGVRAAIEQVVAATQKASAKPKQPAAAPAWAGAQDQVTDWDFGDLPQQITGQSPDQAAPQAPGQALGHTDKQTAGQATNRNDRPAAGQTASHTVRGYPALFASDNKVTLRLATDQLQQQVAMPLGVRQLLLDQLALPAKRLTSWLKPEQALELTYSNYVNTDALLLDVQAAVIATSIERHGVPWTAQAFGHLHDALRDTLEPQVHTVLPKVGELLSLARQIRLQAEQATALAVLNTVLDIKDHIGQLLADGWVSRAGLARLADLRRYLKADSYRLDRLGQSRALEERGLQTVEQAGRALANARATLPSGATEPPSLTAVDWMIEELRVSLFAQQLGTAYPISDKRITKAIAAATELP